jgi:maleamate amidohydrolase
MTMAGHERTALILVDVINSFFEPGHPNHYPEVETVVPAMRALLAAARASGAIVVHAAEKHRPGFEDFEWRKLPVHHLADADDAAFFDGFQPQGPKETVVHKRRFSAFFATDLGLFLTEQKVTRVVIAGVKTNVCIRATAQDAFANGFEPIVAREATNSNRPHLAEASLEDIDRYMGRVVSLDEAIGMLS